MQNTGYKNKILKKTTQAGFTLVELLVSIAIMVMILVLILFNAKGFDSTVVLTNLAYDVGLSIREVQTSGIGVSGKVNSGNFETYTYGVHFDSSTPQSYIQFVDLPDGAGNYDHVYTPGVDLGAKTIAINNKYQILMLKIVIQQKYKHWILLSHVQSQMR
jgi:prepilin-type N-terminal cleavage/methylation domain-containing protein